MGKSLSLYGWFLIVSLWSVGHTDSLTAQVSAEDDFENYLSAIEEDFYTFQDSINRDFADYLEQAWQEFTVYEGTEPPVYAGGGESALAPSSIQVMEEKTAGSPHNTFFGCTLQLPVLPAKSLSLSGLSEKAVADGWRKLAAEDFTSFFGTYRGYSRKLHLNDWGNYQLLKQISQQQYTSYSQRERTLFLFYTLSNAGYRVKIGRTGKASLVLLLPFAEEVYRLPFIRVGEEKYYVLDAGSGHLKKLYSISSDYPKAEHLVSLKIRDALVFPEDNVKHVNRNLLNFYATYPFCNLSVYFSSSPSEAFAGYMDTVVKNHLEGKPGLEQITWLLNFVQHTFTHKPDIEVHGSEVYYFPEETAFYPYADCEDLSVFLSWLIRRYVGGDVLVLYYPAHVALAVESRPGYKGGTLKYRNKEYMICDPSYKGAAPGKVIPACASLKPVIVSYFK
ncbi:hypothetical protein H8784_13275 [Parabacteroides acidifaciens]|uniref:Transglutaminase domain-containing protein n=1 Tax=Parabacteroides acidifaciens TaxID=2290935 RepID=A0A3D8HC71_9BACT|nr:hypothetical protein [Parabacteroides acidifaciens]MBC8602684.1 hypothetical protein [Parabacteroides acidifaciens]RDU48579.1 hypothetical protein DWU89_13630 [Parabacteroides acidifaciens]